jgi:hypothetical protein
MICSFECTFCRGCVERVLANVCPNCGGGFVPRPIRPATDWNGGAYLGNFPASTDPHHHPVDAARHDELRARVGDRAPEDR